MKLIRPYRFWGIQSFGSLVASSLETQRLSMKEADLSRRGTWLCSFYWTHPWTGHYIFKLRLVNTISPPFFPKASVFLTIDILIEVSGISLYITNQVIYIQIMLFPNTSLDFSSHGFKFWTKLATICHFCLCMSLFFLWIFLLISEVINGNEQTEPLAFDGMCESTEKASEYDFYSEHLALEAYYLKRASQETHCLEICGQVRPR